MQENTIQLSLDASSCKTIQETAKTVMELMYRTTDYTHSICNIENHLRPSVDLVLRRANVISGSINKTY